MELKNKKILISGGSSGIGRAIIDELVKAGVQEIAVLGRKQEALDKLQQEIKINKLICIQADVSNIQDLERAVATVEKEFGGLDILINNAGVVSASLLSEMSDEDIINQININVSGLILLTKKALPLLKNSREGAIMNISSGYGYIAMPFYSVYAATKAAVRQFSDAMRRELHQYPLHVMTVYPSATDTNMMQSAVVENMDTAEEVAQKSVAGLLSGEINIILGGKQREEQIKLNFSNPEKFDEIAKSSYDALQKRTENHRAM